MTSPKLATTTTKGRMYTHPTTGASFPSVTTVLGVVGKGDALKHWAAGEVAKYAVKMKDTWLALDDQAAVDLLKREPLRSVDRAASRGTDVHAIAEAYARTGTLPVWADEIGGYVEALRAFFADHQPIPVFIEQTVFNTAIGYAGSFDMICKLPLLGDELVILDYKTSKAIYPEVAAQLAAYANGEEMIDDSGVAQPMPEIKHGVAVRFAIDGTYEVIGCDINLGWEYFKAARHLHLMKPKEMLLGRMATPVADPDEQTRQADNLRKRITYIKDNNPAALTDLVSQWSPSMPTLKSEHVHTMQQLNEINQLVQRIEATHSVQFNDIIVKRPPTRKTAPRHTEEKPVPSDDVAIDEETVTRLRAKLAKSPKAVQESAKILAKDASAARRSISLSGKPTVRRAMLVDFMIDALAESDGEMALLYTIVDNCGLLNGEPLGAILGGCDVQQITQMSTVLSWVQDGTAAVIYNSETGTFSVQKAEQK